MNSNSPKVPEPLQAFLAGEEGVGSIAVDLQAFADFSSAISKDLCHLVDRWAHTAAPSSSRTTFKRDAWL